MATCEPWRIAARASCADREWVLEARPTQGVPAQHAAQDGHTAAGDLRDGVRTDQEQRSLTDTRFRVTPR